MLFGRIAGMALTATAVTATATALTTAPAWAAGHSVFMPGVLSPSTQPVTGKSSGSIALATSSGGVMTCVDTAASKALTTTGTVRVGAVVTDPPPTGWLTGLMFSNCTISGLVATVTPQPWSLSLPYPTASGVTAAQLGNVKFTVNIPAIPCSATFQGSTSSNGYINGKHTNPTSAGAASTLSLPVGSPNNLRATAVSATCPLSIVRWGDLAVFGGVIELRGVNSTANEGPTIT
ncbi:hypothetical protein BKA00_004147 [Actinomadura coerulea]|uniref:Protein activator of alkane oxidation PraB n=1 Tax=Actinomadura coerulea TaxID=46159 RepID=A0A7X0L075_9ACTN|nr:hypothetical protein [Actinomadura coerulea]MBB6397233.1 hypothetical protein [Actinomadura coerulea]